MPETNEVVSATSTDIRQRFHVRELDGSMQMFHRENGTEVPYVPIIPLAGAAAVDVPKPQLPMASKVDIELLERLVAKRIKVLGSTAIRSEFEKMFGGFAAFLAEKAWCWRYASKVTDKAMEAIKTELARVR